MTAVAEQFPFSAASTDEILQQLMAGELVLDEDSRAVVIKESADWIVGVVPMLFNNRVVWSERDEWPGYSAGWCYDKGPAAFLAAAAWDVDLEDEPVGYKKRACDHRDRA